MNEMRSETDRDATLRHIEMAVELFSMLADATRVRLILNLRDGEQSVTGLAEAVNKPQAAVSQHLAKLRLAGFVAPRQVGTKVFYRLTNQHAVRMVKDAIYQAEHALDDVPSHHQVGEKRGVDESRRTRSAAISKRR